MTAEEFHDAWVERGMRCDGTHAIGEALCQNVTAVLATIDATRAKASGEGLRDIAPLIEAAVRASESHLGKAEHAKRLDKLMYDAVRYRVELAALAAPLQGPAPARDGGLRAALTTFLAVWDDEPPEAVLDAVETLRAALAAPLQGPAPARDGGLRAALRPFAEMGGDWAMPPFHDLEDDIVVWGPSAGKYVTAGDVRRARSFFND